MQREDETPVIAEDHSGAEGGIKNAEKPSETSQLEVGSEE